MLRWIAPILDDTSTPERSAEAARKLLLDLPLVSGEVYDQHARPSSRVWPGARDPQLARRVLDESIAFLASHAAPQASRTLSA